MTIKYFLIVNTAVIVVVTDAAFSLPRNINTPEGGEGISLKYLERIMPVLVKNNLIVGTQGKGGGYRLSRTPEEYKISEILHLTEGNLAPVSRLACENVTCDKADICRTRSMWEKLHEIIDEYFDGITLADLMKNFS